MKVLLDLDGVLADFNAGAAKVFNVQYPCDWPPAVYDVAAVFGIESRLFWEGIVGSKFWAELPWMPDGHMILEIMEEFSKDICILTSPTLDPSAAKGKMEWMQRELPRQYRRKFLIGPAKEFCANPDHLLIDDSDANYTKFTDAGGKAILVPRPWNSNHALDPIKHLTEQLEKYR